MATKPLTAPRHDPKITKALRNFAISITAFNIAGYVYLGFEQPWLWPVVAVLTGYTVEIVLETIGARSEGRAPRYLGGGAKGLMEFLYPAHITSLALNMLIYVNDQIWMMMFGVTVAVGAKWVLRAPVRGKLRHFMNPSNFGIFVIVALIPWASIAPPYHFTEHVSGPVDWIIPGAIVVAGTILNGKLTGRLWLVAAWLSVFALQSIVRGIFFDTSIPAALVTMTGVAFVLFTNYMITDPGTSPSKPASQMAFGGGVALLYGVLMIAHIPYTIFIATAAVCLIRGCFLWALHFANRAAEQRAVGPSARAAAARNGEAETALAQSEPVAMDLRPAHSATADPNGSPARGART